VTVAVSRFSRLDRRVRRPRVRIVSCDGCDVEATYKGATLWLQRAHDRARWYIRVRDKTGRYAYDGWWEDSKGKQPVEAIAEACRGAGLWTPNAELSRACVGSNEL
jgi:hypothetical protein